MISNLQAQNWRILHIDDDEDDHFLVRTMFKEAKGQTVTLDWAATFEEGRQKLSETEYQAVLVDYDLGARTGIELIRTFVNQGYAAPFILLTGRGSYEVDVEAMHAGATLYLTKNEINPLLLERSVRYAIERKQVEMELRQRDRKLSVALDAAHLGAWTYNFADHMFEMDERAQKMYNTSQPRENHDEIVQRFLHPDDVQPMWEALRKAADPAGDGRYQMEYRIQHPDGSLCWLSAWGLAEFEGQGDGRRAVRLTGASREITWEKQAALALKETNTALRESERSVKELAGRFQAVLENSLDAAYRRNLQTDRYDYLSPVIEQVMGFSVDELVNMPIADTLSRMHPDDLEQVLKGLEQASEQGKGKLEYRFLCKDSLYRWFADYVTVTKDASGNLLYRTGIVRDITDQVRAEKALRASEERFELASRAVAGVLYDISLTRDEMYQSEGLERVVGYRPGQEPGGSSDWWPRNIHPDDYPRVQANLQAAMNSSSESYAYEYRIRHKDGHWVHVFDQGYIVRAEDGQAKRLVGICTDISDRVRTELALRESEARFRDLANNISQLAWMADKTGHIFWYNQRWFDYTGTTPEQMEKEGWRKLFHPDHVERVVEKINRCLSTGENWEDIFPLRGKDGQYRWFLSQAKPIKDDREQVVRWFGTNTDITEQVHLQEKNNQQSEFLQESESRSRELAKTLELERAKLAIAIDHLPLGIGIMDAEGNILTLNGAGLKLHGFTSESEMFSRLEKYIEEFELRYLDGRLMPLEEWPASKALRGEFVKDYALRLRNLVIGGEHIVSYSSAPVNNADGQMLLIVFVIQDLTDQKQAEETMRESEARYRLAARAINDAIWDWDLTTDKIQWNESLTELFGYPETSLCCSSGSWWKSRIHPEDQANVIHTINEVISGDGDVWTASYRFQRVDGSYADIYDRGWVVRDELGSPIRMVGAMRDVTRQNEAAQALREREAMFRQLADAMPQLVWTARPDGTVDYYNQRYRDYGGIAPNINGEWEWGPVLHTDDLQPTVDAWGEALRTATTYQVEHRVRMADGSYKWHLSRGIPVFDENGKVLRWYGTATDIDDFKQAQEMLRHREKRLRSLFEANLIGIVTRDRDGKILEANEAYLQITGYTCEDVEAGRLNARNITLPEYHHFEPAWIEEVLANGYCKPFEKEYVHKDGRRIPVLVGYSLFETEQTEFIGFVLDLSELKKTQAELAEYAEKLKRSNEELENFAFVASHDLQEPLRKINLFTSSLRRQMDGQISEKSVEYLDRMQNASERMQAMINGLLELSRVNTRGSTFEPVGLRALAEEVVSDLEGSIHANGGQVIIGPLPTVDGDALQLRRLLQNLVGNALKFHREDVAPVVRVSGELLGAGKTRQARIVIEDNGIGFEEESANEIFQPFVRLHGRSQYEGSGIGLAICRKIVERHEGTITASSQPGSGSKFIITLPVSRVQAPNGGS